MRRLQFLLWVVALLSPGFLASASSLEVSELPADILVRTILLHSQSVHIGDAIGNIPVSVVFDQIQTDVAVASPRAVGLGGIYSIRFAHEVALTVTMNEGYFHVEGIRGISLMARIPLLSNEVRLEDVILNYNTGIATVRARAIWNLVELIAEADIVLRRIDSLDWFAPILQIMPALISSVRFHSNSNQ